MAPEIWTPVDDYFTQQLVEEPSFLQSAREASEAAGLPAIAVSITQGKLLNLFAKMIGAKRILEIGTLGGYSAIWMALALPENGKLTTLEFESHHAEVARKNIDSAGVGSKVDIRVGAALDLLPTLGNEPFDLIFVDADKQNNPHYFRWAMKLSHPGTVIIVDNVVRNGAVVDAASDDEMVLGVRQMMEVVHAETRFNATALQTVGSKGYDGFMIGIVG